MKITKSKLKQIITEELQNILAEVDPTKVLDPVEMAKKRQADRKALYWRQGNVSLIGCIRDQRVPLLFLIQ